MVLFDRNHGRGGVRKVVRGLVECAGIHRQTVDFHGQRHRATLVEIEKIDLVKAALELGDPCRRLRGSAALVGTEINAANVEVKTVVGGDLDLVDTGGDINVAAEAQCRRSHFETAIALHRTTVVAEEFGNRRVALARSVGQFAGDERRARIAFCGLARLINVPNARTRHIGGSDKPRAFARDSRNASHANCGRKSGGCVRVAGVKICSRVHVGPLPCTPSNLPGAATSSLRRIGTQICGIGVGTHQKYTPRIR